jgi:hypothetical protein
MLALMRNRWKRLIMLGMLALMAAPRPAAACSYSVPGWYTVSTTLGTPALPAGISLAESGPSASGGSGSTTISISNTTPTPLYLIANFMTGAEEFDDIGQRFPDGYGPTHKVVDGQAWVWSPPHYTGKSGWTWQPSRNALELFITEGAIETTQGVVLYFTTQIGDNRPEDAQPPAPEQGEIRLVYGSQLIVIPVEITYALNSAYRPDAMAHMAAACNNPNSLKTFVTIDPATGRMSTVTPPATAPAAPTALPVATATLEAQLKQDDGRSPTAAGSTSTSGLLAASGGAIVLAAALAWRGLRRRT